MAESLGKRWGLPVLLTGAAVMGMSAIFVRWAGEMPSAVLGFYRMLVGLAVILPMALREGAIRREERSSLLWAALGGVSFSLDLFLWHYAIRWTSAANATLLVGLAPLWVALFCALVLGMRMKLSAWFGFAFALGGAACLGISGGASFGSGSIGSLRGELLAVVASFGYAGYTLCLSRARQHLSSPRSLAAAVLAACLSFSLMALLGGNAFSGFSGNAWLAALALGLVVQVLAWWLISWGLGHVSASNGSLGLLVQQVATVFLGWSLLGEIPGPAQWVGISLILAGIWMASR